MREKKVVEGKQRVHLVPLTKLKILGIPETPSMLGPQLFRLLWDYELQQWSWLEIADGFIFPFHVRTKDCVNIFFYQTLKKRIASLDPSSFLGWTEALSIWCSITFKFLYFLLLYSLSRPLLSSSSVNISIHLNCSQSPADYNLLTTVAEAW